MRMNVSINRPKYRNQKCMGYDSQREAQRAAELKLMLRVYGIRIREV